MRKIDTLKKNYEFKNVLNKGKFYRGNYITIYITKNNNLNTFFTDYTPLQFYLSFLELSILLNLYFVHFPLISKLSE